MSDRRMFDRYSLYGEENAAIAPEFLHVEPISTRSSRYEWTIAPHTHPGIFQLLLLERGGGSLSADGLAVQLRPPSLVTIPAGAIHAFAFAEDAEGWVLSLASALVAQLAGEGRLRNLPGASAGAELLDAQAGRRLSWLIGEIAGDLARTGDRRPTHSTFAAVSHVLALAEESVTPTQRPAEASGTEARREELVRRFRALVDRHFREGWPVARYAAALGASTPSLTRACHAVLGRAPGEVALERVQLEAMRALTYSASSISRIADELGFADPAYFARFFKARTGMTASRFRRSRAWFDGAGNA